MADVDPTSEAQRFISEHISSVAQLEMLLLLRTTHDEARTADELARELRVESSWAEAELEGLANRGLVASSGAPAGAYRFKPRTPELERAVTAVARAYLLHRVSIIEMIYSKPSDSISDFANAFRLKRGPSNG